MAPEPIAVSVSTDPDMPAWAIRLEGKVDLVVAQQAQRLDNHESDLKDHEVRLRGLEATQPESARERIRSLEERKTVSPAQLWTAIASGLTAIGGASAAISILQK